MILNYIWIALFLLSMVFGLGQWIITGDQQIFSLMFKSLMDMSKTGFEIALGLTGILTFWMGMMRVGEVSGAIQKVANLIDPFFRKLFPEVPKGHPAIGSMMLNLSANMLGLGDAATPMGLKAMKELQDINPDKETASNAQIMFLVLNAAGFTLVPITVIMYRLQFKAANPSDVFIPILITTFSAALAGLIAVSIKQRINLFNRTLFIGLLSLCLFVAGLIYFFLSLEKSQMQVYSNLFASIVVFAIMTSFILMALWKKISVFEVFIEGAKEGFNTAVRIIPYLVAILCVIALFRSSGGFDFIMNGVIALFNYSGLPTDFVPALPTALMKPLSGSGARGMMLELLEQQGPDSFAGRLACIFQGSVDTTLYIVAVYFGSVGVKNSRYAVGCGLIADLVSVITAITVAYLFFG
ncbi:MAG: rane protein [Chitinophagaceae bacterium]|nr:rane protein [Chitinophagaceae bacterium]